MSKSPQRGHLITYLTQLTLLSSVVQVSCSPIFVRVLDLPEVAKVPPTLNIPIFLSTVFFFFSLK